MQDDAHFLAVARYIERNALRAGLATQALASRWSSLWRRLARGGEADRVPLPLAVWPVEQPLDWLTWVNQPQTQTELDAIRVSVIKGRPFGEISWQQSVTRKLGLESSHRPAGRPSKKGGQSNDNRT